MRGLLSFVLPMLVVLSAEPARADDSPPPQTAVPSTRNVELYQSRPLDGVTMNAIETYPNPKSSSIGIGIGLYPFNAYYTGFVLNGNYTYHFSRGFAWEILNVSYAFTFQTSLTTELAQNYNVNPKSIDYISLLVNTDAVFELATGKFVLLRDYLRYFNFSFLLGGGFVDTLLEKDFGPVAGLRAEVFSSSNFSWRMDIRNTLTIPGFTNYVVVALNMGLNF